VECYLVEEGCAMRALEDISCNKPSKFPDAADVVCGTKSFCYFSGDC